MNQGGSFIFDRNWHKVNPQNEITVSIDQARQFLKLNVQEHQSLKQLTQQAIEEISQQSISQKIQTFIFKYVQQKELANSKRQLPTLQKSPYRLDLNECLQIWRWINSDSLASTDKQVEDDINEFEVSASLQTYEIKKNVDYNSKNKKIFSQLSLEQQEMVLKKSLQMVHMYYHQFKIIFNHYCRFVIQNQHKRTFTFDDVSHSLETLTLNRFMLFCRQFDIIKTLQFKKKTQHNPSMSKSLLLKIYQKAALLQKYMNFDNFLMSLVHISIKIHQNFDPRSYMHIELFLNSLKVKYYQQFTKRLQSLSIKYSPTDFYNCYKHILKKQVTKVKIQRKDTVFNNPYFAKSSINTLYHEENQQVKEIQNKLDSRMKSYQSVPNLVYSTLNLKHSSLSKAPKKLQKRKSSIPILPALQENRYFKRIEPSQQRSIYNKYLQNFEQSSSVFKNRITGYSNINKLKTKGFHTTENPQSISKKNFEYLLQKQRDQASKQIQGREQSEITNVEMKNILQAPSKNLLEAKQKKEVIEALKEKIDLNNNDQILKNLMVGEQNREKSKV